MKSLFVITHSPFAVYISTSSKEIGLYVNRKSSVNNIQDFLMVSEIFIGFVQNRLVSEKEYCVGKMTFSFRIDDKAKVVSLNVNLFDEIYRFDKLECNYIASTLKKLMSEVKFSKYSEYVDVLEDDESEMASYGYYR
jgi:hypothetical protein